MYVRRASQVKASGNCPTVNNISLPAITNIPEDTYVMEICKCWIPFFHVHTIRNP